MAALTADFSPKEHRGDVFNLTMKTAEVFYVGSTVVEQTSDQKAEKGTTKLAVVCRGVCVTAVTEGQDPEVTTVEVQRGTFQRRNSAGDPILATTPLGSTVYIEDDQTMAVTDSGGTQSAGGTFQGFEGTDVKVKMGVF